MGEVFVGAFAVFIAFIAGYGFGIWTGLNMFEERKPEEVKQNKGMMIHKPRSGGEY